MASKVCSTNCTPRVLKSSTSYRSQQQRIRLPNTMRRSKRLSNREPPPQRRILWLIAQFCGTRIPLRAKLAPRRANQPPEPRNGRPLHPKSQLRLTGPETCRGSTLIPQKGPANRLRPRLQPRMRRSRKSHPPMAFKSCHGSRAPSGIDRHHARTVRALHQRSRRCLHAWSGSCIPDDRDTNLTRFLKGRLR